MKSVTEMETGKRERQRNDAEAWVKERKAREK